MKLRTITALASVLAISVLTPACGDDDDTSTDTDNVEDDDAGADDDDAMTDDDAPPEDDDAPPEDDDMPPEDDDVPPEDDDMPPEDDDVPPEDDDMPPEDDDVPVEDDAGPDDDMPVECTSPAEPAVPADPDCPAIEDRAIVEVQGDIGDASWDCQSVYYLTGPTYVVDGTLEIGPGTEVLGDAGSALIVTRGAQLDAVGTPTQPVVFSSSKLPGERLGGDWGGVVLLGDAPINVAGGVNPIEGIDPTEGRGEYGGSDPDSSCGTLRYARIEFAGFVFGTDNELNGLTLGGCGAGTVLDYIQVHRGTDDGIEFFGGTASIKHAIVSNAQDDSLDWDFGWSGNVQHLVVMQDGSGDAGFESDNNVDSHDAEPRSNPLIYNLSMFGGGPNGMVLRRGTGGRIYNAIVRDFAGNAVDVRDAATAAGAEAGWLTVANSIFWANGTDFATDVPEFDAVAFFTDPAQANRQVNPALATPDQTAPDFIPGADSPAAEGGATPPEDGFFDHCATYVGAFEPGGANWAEGWTAYPED